MTNPDQAQWLRRIVTAALTAVLIGITFWAYRPALDVPFVFDDFQNIVDSPAIRWTKVSLENLENALEFSLLGARPVANLTFAFDHLRGGLDPRSFHLTNIVIHLLVGGVLLWLASLYAKVTVTGEPAHATSRIARVSPLVFLPVVLFLVHPLNTQAVTYVVQRMASLAAFFVLLSFASYLVARHQRTSRPVRWYLLAIVAWLLGVGAKENAVLLLPVLFAYELCFFREEWRARTERALRVSWNRSWTVGFWMTVIGLSLLAGSLVMLASDSIGLFADFPNRDFNGMERLLTQSRVQLFHLFQLFWPEPGQLNLDHDFSVSRGLLEPATTLPAVMACLALLMSAIILATHKPRYGFPLVAYALFHAAEAGPLGLELIFEHRMYLPMSMLAVLAAVLFIDAEPRSRTILIPLLCIIALVFAGWTKSRNETWADPFEFSRDMVVKSPDKSRVQHNFAMALLNEGRIEEALIHIKRAVQLDDSIPVQWGLLGRIQGELGNLEESVAAYQAVLDLDPDSVKALLGLGRALDRSARQDEAYRLLLGAGVRLARSGRPFEAMPLLELAESLDVADADVHIALGNTYVSAGMSDRALEQYRLAIEIDPATVSAWYNLGSTADSLGRSTDALRAYEEFVRLAPPELKQQVQRAKLRIEALRISSKK